MVIKTGKNLFDSTKSTDGSYLENDNTVHVSASFAYTDYIPVTPGLVYTGQDATLAGMRKTCYFNSSKVLVAGGSSAALTSFTCPAGVAFVRVSYTLANKASFQFEQAAAATVYESYRQTVTSLEGYPIKNSDIDVFQKSETYSAAAIDAKIPVVVTAGIGASKNLANPALFTDGAYLENDNTIHTNVQYGYTDYIAVIAGLSYTGWDGSNGMRKVCYFNSSKVLVAGGSSVIVTTFIPPAGVAFVRVSYYLSGKVNFQFEQNATHTSFVPFANAQLALYSVNGALVTINEPYKRISLANTKMDVWFGDSYMDGPYKLKGKAVLNKISMFTDRRIENYSRSGNALVDILARIQSNNKTYHASVGIKSYATGGLGFIGSWTNEFGTGDSMNGSASMNTYFVNLQRVCEAVKALGYKPVIFDEHSIINTGSPYGQLAQMAISEFCAKHNYDFIDIKESANLLTGSTNNPLYWYGTHPGTRTDSVYWVPFLNYYQSLPRPETSLKIYRKRSTVAVSTLADLLYTTLADRASKFKELFIAQYAFVDGQAQYWDDLTNLANGAGFSGANVCEYLQLQNNESVSFPDYALIECVVNATANRMTAFRLYLSDPSLQVYVIDWVNKTTVLVPASVGSDGKSYYVPTDFKSQLLYDKISFIVYKTGPTAFTLSDVYFEYLGLEGKDLSPRPLPVRSPAAEVLANPIFNTALTGWTVTGTLASFTPTDTNVPLGADKLITVTTANYVSQAFTFAANTERNRKAQIRVIARNRVADFPSTNSYPSTSPVTDDTFDFASLGIDISLNSNNIISFTKLVGLHWTEVLMEIVIPISLTTLTLVIKSRDVSIDVGKASVKIEA